MQVVKFGDRGIATRKHFAIRLLRDCRQQVSVEPPCQRIHALTPGPEVVVPGRRALFGLTRERSLECVAVGIAKTRNDDARYEVTGLRRGIGSGLPDSPTVKLQADIVCPALLQQRFASENRRHWRPIKLYIQLWP